MIEILLSDKMYVFSMNSSWNWLLKVGIIWVNKKCVMLDSTLGEGKKKGGDFDFSNHLWYLN